MALLPNIVCLVLLLHKVPHSLGLVEGARGAGWHLNGDISNALEHPGKVIGELGGDIKKGVEGFAKKAEHIGEHVIDGAEKVGSEIIGDIEKGAEGIVDGIEHGVIGNIAKGAGELVEDVGKGAAGIIGGIGEGAENVIGGIGEGIEKGAEGIIDGAKGAIDGIGDIVGKLTPNKKKHGKDDDSHHNKHKKGGDSKEKHHGSQEKHQHKHKKEDSREKHGSHEKHHKKGGKHQYNQHTGRGIDHNSGIGSRDGIKTPILDLLGLTKSICKVSYAAETVIADLGELHMWADKQMGMIEHAAVNYVIDNVVLKAVDGVRKYHNKIVDFIIDAHIGIQRLVTNTLIEGYRVSKAPIRELFACY